MLGKLKNLFGKKDTTLDAEPTDFSRDNAIQPAQQQRSGSSIFRPWARRDQAIQSMTQGFTALTDLMGGIKSNLEDNARRQDELLNYLSHLPEALASIPESQRVHGETLKAIHQQIAHQTIQQDKLGEILDKLTDTGGRSSEKIDEVADRLEAFRESDRTLADQLTTMGSAMQTVSRTSGASADVLTQLHSTLQNRDSQLENVLHRQNARFTTMLAIAIFLSVAALVAVSIIGYLILTKRGLAL